MKINDHRLIIINLLLMIIIISQLIFYRNEKKPKKKQINGLSQSKFSWPNLTIMSCHQNFVEMSLIQNYSASYIFPTEKFISEKSEGAWPPRPPCCAAPALIVVIFSDFSSPLNVHAHNITNQELLLGRLCYALESYM